MSSSLILHKGGYSVSRDELAAVETPRPEGRWYPTPHLQVLNAVDETLVEAGYSVRSERLGLIRGGSRFFGVLDLGSSLADGVALSVGIRNSTDRSFPLGFCAGSRVFVCDNLAFSSELMVRRKHTLNGARNFRSAIAGAVGALRGFRELEEARIKFMQERELGPEEADATILRSYERDIISINQLPVVLREWREPSFPDFVDRTAWSLMNAFTFALKARAVTNPTQFAAITMRLGALLAPQTGRADEPCLAIPA